MSITDTAKFYAKDKQQWRQWLAKNHDTCNAIWLIKYNKATGKPSVSWSDSVDEALCFGWIDGVQRKWDEESSIQYFTKRKPKSTWSKINKDKVAALIASGSMTEAGMRCIEIAKQNGSWEILDAVEQMIIPDDLAAALSSQANAMDYFMGLSKSTKKAMLQWLVMTNQPATRQKRIHEIAILAAAGKKPKQF